MGTLWAAVAWAGIVRGDEDCFMSETRKKFQELSQRLQQTRNNFSRNSKLIQTSSSTSFVNPPTPLATRMERKTRRIFNVPFRIWGLIIINETVFSMVLASRHSRSIASYLWKLSFRIFHLRNISHFPASGKFHFIENVWNVYASRKDQNALGSVF